ncbi:hypothetical protein QYE76_054509 [Lolium multiflorum]|uniref:Uncharacterized protein n=1 Tax=Lolium multiflorum TaxID=4521 RepID=A0AAD8SYS5_LOLMU|nr:hypothetical protein QYE76_054509 [Lolium multiflorum]
MPRLAFRFVRRARSVPCGDGLGAPDIVLGRAGQKEALGRMAGNVYLSGAPQIPLGDGLGDAAGDALTMAMASSSLMSGGWVSGSHAGPSSSWPLAPPWNDKASYPASASSSSSTSLSSLAARFELPSQAGEGHQFHLGSDEEEKDGELVVSKVFYQTQPRQCGGSATVAAAAALAAGNIIMDGGGAATDHHRHHHEGVATTAAC